MFVLVCKKHRNPITHTFHLVKLLTGFTLIGERWWDHTPTVYKDGWCTGTGSWHLAATHQQCKLAKQWFWDACNSTPHLRHCTHCSSCGKSVSGFAVTFRILVAETGSEGITGGVLSGDEVQVQSLYELIDLSIQTPEGVMPWEGRSQGSRMVLLAAWVSGEEETTGAETMPLLQWWGTLPRRLPGAAKRARLTSEMDGTGEPDLYHLQCWQLHPVTRDGGKGTWNLLPILALVDSGVDGNFIDQNFPVSKDSCSHWQQVFSNSLSHT